MQTLKTTFIPSPVTSLVTLLTLASAVAAQSRPHFLTPTQMPAPINVAGASSYSMALSADGLRAMVETDRAGGRGGRDLVLLQRPTTQSSFTSYGPLGFCGAYDEGGGQFPELDVGLGFSSNRPGGAGGHDVYGFGMGTGPVEFLNSPWDETEPSLTSDGLEFFFTSNRPGSLGGKSIWRATRASVNDAWGSPVLVTDIDSANHEESPSLTDDGLWLFFSSNRGGNFDIYVAARSSRQSPFGAPARVAELSGPNHDIGIEIAPGDAQAFVTVLINGRAVILSAPRSTSSFAGGGGAGLSASSTVAPGELLSVQLRAPAGDYGVVLLGVPTAPIQTFLGELRLDPAALMVLDAGVLGPDELRTAQLVLPSDPRLRGVPIALQGLSGPAPELRLTNAVTRAVE
jgi:hypothetical protein